MPEINTLLGLQHGYYDYNDLTTQTTPIPVPNTGAWIQLTNDGAGPYTVDTYKPTGDGEIWNTLTNQFDFSGLNYGDRVEIRYDVNIETLGNNGEVIMRAHFGVGSGGDYYRTLAHNHYKNISPAENITVDIGEHISSNIIKDYPAQIEISSDVALNVTVNGWYVRVLKRTF